MKSLLRYIAKKIFARFLQTREKFGFIQLEGIYAIVTSYGYKNLDFPSVLPLIEKIRSTDRWVLQSNLEMYQLYALARKTDKLPGDVAEVGVYRGGSARIIREATKKEMYLFDTFEGVPKPGIYDEPDQAEEGELAFPLEAVKDYLKDYKDIFYYKGLFPDSATSQIREKKYSFVHLDVDLYQSTLDGLKFFYPRMVPGGVIICHDYGKIDGARKAFDEFFADKPEIIIKPVETIQCFIVKV